ncbi:hypothetical protein CR983_00335 [Candidatus Saccharibacteria bacterium]|nr:MAG: hypothetical protein CR983_00335 [Candidatus Saccharibacteria bacterium]
MTTHTAITPADLACADRVRRDRAARKEHDDALAELARAIRANRRGQPGAAGWLHAARAQLKQLGG